jgi:uncharacterized coiled-coil DUF342 family protein
MKKDDLMKTLKIQYKNTVKEIEKLEGYVQNKKEILIKLEGALEALEALEQEEPPTPSVPDHTEAAKALGVFK